MRKKVELLAPAGNYECFLGAINAGADAVYLSGEKYGARAYAHNFSEEELCDAIKYAHLHGKKVYLTMNTLFKQDELKEVYDYLLPYYVEGLDGVIIQDIGLFQQIKKDFPLLELHCSTQMSITGALGAKAAKEMGAERIVPARELSLKEVKNIIDTVDIEVECFIHGSMCYCFSGQCLFSSMLGGRSGNRGRCAQPCRLPYNLDKKSKNEMYLLSLKDLCTIEHIGSLIECGISSFKIEGRMKQPEYVAGVTKIYRKYIDMYYANPSKKLNVDKKDQDVLSKLYVRSQIMDGYYTRHNDKSMITMEQPGYQKNEESLLANIRANTSFIKEKLGITIKGVFNIGELASITIECNEKSITVYGETVSIASNAPIDEERIKIQLEKLGNTNFYSEKTEIEMDDSIFYSMKLLNELRRNAIDTLENELISKRNLPQIEEIIESNVNDNITSEAPYIVVKTKEQLDAVIEQKFYYNIVLDSGLFLQIYDELKQETSSDYNFYVALPYIIRMDDVTYLHHLYEKMQSDMVKGVFVRNLECYQFLKQQDFTKKIILDTNINIINMESYNFFKNDNISVVESFELNAKELRQLKQKGFQVMKVMYGHIPMMLSANCVKKTTTGCNHKQELITMYDRYQIGFKVSTECAQCYNIIYNSVPLSLHNNFEKIANENTYILSFSIENKSDTIKVLEYYKKRSLMKEEKLDFVFENFTTGHEKKGIE